jgi:hypothetical protein
MTTGGGLMQITEAFATLRKAAEENAGDDIASALAAIAIAEHLMAMLDRIADGLAAIGQQPHYHPGPGQKLTAIGDKVVIE